ncbi:MAG: outer membrane lipoprotein carrier protein LolA [Proteobacteria bacterium]|nr:outer membrane lipoprotein carrier protein LolA [Pseudomonadota bacterium]
MFSSIIHVFHKSLHPSIILFCAMLSFLFCGVLEPSTVTANTLEPLAIAEKLQTTYEEARTLSADFKQTTALQLSSRVKQGAGSMVFQKPGQMRWDYVEPDQQVLISDGKTISMYFEKSKQMIITAAKEFLQSDVTYSFFAGKGDVIKDFEILEPNLPNSITKGSYIIKLVPRKTHPQVAYMHAWITKQSFLINRLQIVDHFDTVTDLHFSNIQVNAEQYNNRKIDDDLFFFMPPADTEIIEQ